MALSDAVVSNLTTIYVAVIACIKLYGFLCARTFTGVFVVMISTTVVGFILMATLTWDVSRKATYAINRYHHPPLNCKGGICWHGVAVRSPASQVLLTPTHLAIVMEYAAGGELFERICSAGRFSEDEARFFFQQLISGVSYCHSMLICHRDLKLENTLLDGSTAPRVKICDFGYSKSSVLHSQPKSTVGTPAYIAPEVLTTKEYDGKIADVWSCGVTLYVMLVGAYPFEDPADPKDFKKTISKILSVQYKVPDFVRVSMECINLLSQIFVANPEKRITIPEIKNHPWFLRNLPVELMEGGSWQSNDVNNPSQSVDEVLSILQEARKPLNYPKIGGLLSVGSMDLDEFDLDTDLEDIEMFSDFVGPPL